MKHQLMVVIVILHQGFTHSLLHFDNNNNKSVKSKVFEWIDEFCDIFRNNDVKSKDLSLETYFTNESRKSMDFFESLSRHISRSNEHHSLSLSSHIADDFLHYDAHDYLENIIRIKSEIQYRVVLLNNETIDMIFHSMFRWNNEQHTFIIFYFDDDDQYNDDKMRLKSMDFMEHVLKKIWQKFGVYNVFFPSYYGSVNKSHAWMYNPFFKDEIHQNYGKLMEVELSNECIRSLSVFRNFNGYEINVGLFHSPPSAPRINKDESDIEDPVVEDFYGVDGYVVDTFVKYCNLRVKIRGPSDGIEYGFVEANGTYTGTLGDVANGRVSASFNSQYIKKYSPIGKPSDVLEFSTPIDNDRVCIIVPSPDEIPRWLRLYHSFRPAIWACFAVSMIVSSLFWRIMQYSSTRNPPSYHDVFLETFLIYIGAPVDVQRIRRERMLVAAMLFLGMTIMAVLTGTIYDSFTVEMFYPAINTLEELDHNGLTIGTSALSLIDIFGSSDNDTASERPVLARLQHKLKYTPYNPSLPSIKRTALLRDIASIARFSSFAVSRHEYVDDKGRSLLHLVGDCPQTYHLGYLLPKHSYLRKPLDHMILKLQQGGFVKLWKIRAIRTLIYQHIRRHQGDDKLKDPLPFTIIDMQTCFLILGFGLGISICVFIGEIVFKPGYRLKYTCRKNQGTRSNDG